MPVLTSAEPRLTTPPLSLSAEEVRLLLEEKSPAALLSITGKIAGAYSQQSVKSHDTKAAEQIFRLLIRETEIPIRMALSQHVKSNINIPKDIALSLARDVEEVSLPMLQYSQVLDDKDLLELISNTQSINRYLAISRRELLSDTVSGTLLDKNNAEVATSLVHNMGADISEEKLVCLIATSSDNKALMQALKERPQLPVSVTEKLISAVSTNLGNSLKQKYQESVPEIQQDVDKTRESETLRLVRGSRSQEDIDKLINQLHAFNRLTPSIILSALAQGNFEFFETSLARLSTIPVANARALIADRGELGFKAIYNKSGLPEPMFPAVRLLLTIVHDLDRKGEKPGGSRYANRVIEQILHHSATVPTDNLSYIIALVRRATF